MKVKHKVSEAITVDLLEEIGSRYETPPQGAVNVKQMMARTKLSHAGCLNMMKREAARMGLEMKQYRREGGRWEWYILPKGKP